MNLNNEIRCAHLTKCNLLLDKVEIKGDSPFIIEGGTRLLNAPHAECMILCVAFHLEINTERGNF